MSSLIKIKHIKPIDKLNYLHSFKIEYLSKSNQSKVWEMVSRHDINRLRDEIENHANYTDGVTIFATDISGENIVLIKEFRVSAGRYVYALPAGLIDAEESIEDAAIREFKEETGLNLTIGKISPARYTSVGLSNEKVNIVYGTYTGTPSNMFLEDSEDIEVVIAGRDQVKDFLTHCEVPIRTALIIERYFQLI